MKKQRTTPFTDPKMYPKLTKRQQMVYDYIVMAIEDNGYPPTLREIGDHMGISSTNGVNDHLKALQRKGYLLKGELRARALTPIGPDTLHKTKPRRIETAMANNPDTMAVPLLGRVAAGQPIPRVEDSETYLQVDHQLLGTQDEVFALKISGDSMVKAGIYDNDFLFVKRQAQANNGDIVVFVMDDEVTVKRFFRERGKIRLQPENDHYEPIVLTPSRWRRQCEIIGIAKGVYRKL